MHEIERTPLAENVSALLDDTAECHRDRPFLVFSTTTTPSPTPTLLGSCATWRVLLRRSGWEPPPTSR